MSGAKRAYDILRGYVSREWERIQGVERDLAENELEEALRNPMKAELPNFERTHNSPNPRTAEPPNRFEETEELIEELAVDRVSVARRYMGVSETAKFDAVRKAFERLSTRSDPANFPEGSMEQERATEIRKRVYWAYHVLAEHFDATERRFRSLELE